MMNRILLLYLFLVPGAAFAQPSDEAKRLVEVFGWKQLYQDVVMVPGWNDLSTKQQERFEAETDYSVGKLVNNLASWIDREFTPKEIKEIVKFFDTEAGQKFSRIIFHDREGTGDLHHVIGDWAAGRHQAMRAYLSER